MDKAILVVRIGLAVVLIVAGIAKMLDRGSTRQAIPEFGLPDVLAQPIAIALPIVELAVGVLMIPASTARLAAVVALLLFGSFSAVVAVALVRGRRPECHCFGQLSSGAISAGTLVRSALLALAAAFVAVGWVDPALSVAGEVRDLSASDRTFLLVDVVLLAAVGVVGYASRRLLLQQREILRRLDEVERRARHGSRHEPSTSDAPSHGLAVGTSAPRFSLRLQDGAPASLDGLLAARKPVLLVFVGPRCVPCKMLLPEIAWWGREDAELFTIGLVSRGDVAENVAMSRKWGLANVLVQREHEVDDLYGVTGTPAAVLIGVDATIATPVANSAREIKSLVASLGGTAKPADERGRHLRAESPARAG